MSEPLESELAGVTLESDALPPPQEVFPPGDLRRHPEAPGHLYLGQAAAVPTSGQPQVRIPSEDPINFEFEAGDGEAPQPPVPSGSQAAPTVTTGGAVGDPLQHNNIIKYTRIIYTVHNKFGLGTTVNKIFISLGKEHSH
jgi:hypothetical protein